MADANFYHVLEQLLKEDAEILRKKNQEYGDSWRKRGGIGAFMMLARKWDRLEPQVAGHGYDIFEAMIEDCRPEGVLDDIGDLRRYLALVEAQYRAVLRHLPQARDHAAEPDRHYVDQEQRQMDLFGDSATAPHQLDLFT